MTADELRKIENRYRRAHQRAETEREARNAAVRQAIAEGWTYQAIADVIGLAAQRIGQIALQGQIALSGDGRASDDGPPATAVPRTPGSATGRPAA